MLSRDHYRDTIRNLLDENAWLSIDHYRDTIRNLSDENARLKRKLEKVLEAIDSSEYSICPDSVGLTNKKCRNCVGCWKQALEEVE